MIFLILPVWWVPCVLVPIVPVLSLVPWWCTRGATPKDTRIFNAKRRQGEQHFKHEENKIQIRIVVIPYIVPMFFIERDLLKTCAALRIYPSAKNPQKKNMFHWKAIFNSNFHQVGCSRPLHVECPHGLLWEGIIYMELAQEADSWAQTLTFQV